jgi:20S proteasome alpha/beta subunit
MIKTSPKPLPRPIVPHPKSQRLPKGKLMTLVSGFRCADGSIVLGADREQVGSFGKRSVEKLFRIVTNQGSFLIGGAGRSSIADNALMRMEKALITAGANANIVLSEAHKDVIETILHEVHEEYIWGNRDENNRTIQFIIAAAFQSSAPFLYRTDEEIVYPQQLYACAGIGQDLAYYFADKLYNDHLSPEGAVLISAFIFREVSQAVSGVGLGADLWVLHGKNQGLTRIPPNKVKELEAVIPDIEKAISDAWNGHIAIPEWLTRLFT